MSKSHSSPMRFTARNDYAFLSIIHPCTLLMMQRSRCVALPALLKIACPEVYIRVHFWTRVFAEQKRRRWMKPRTSLSVLKLQGASTN